jgi:integrase
LPKLLTEITVRNLKPRADRYEVGDAGARCLRVIVQPSGFKSYVVRYTNVAGRRRKLTLPAGITLAAARKLAGDAMFEVARGEDPATAKQAARRSGRAQVDDTVERLAHQFLEQHAKRQTRIGTYRATAGIFRNIVLPAWGRRSVHDIARRDVIDLVEGVAVDRPVMANRVHAALSRFFRWLCVRDVVAASPCTGVPRPTRETPRDRVLTDGEIRRLWAACEALDARACACVRLLILSGQRRGEIAALRWSEVGDGALTFPAARMKGKQDHACPLSAQAAAIVAAMPRDGSHVFGRTLRGDFGRIKRALDARMGDAPHWTVHDMRRSVASGMAKIGVAVPVIEKILAHRGGSFKGVAGIYQRHSFLPEMAVAMQKWANYVEALVSGRPAKVVKLPRR